MGWCSGTEFFDVAVDVALKHCYKIDGSVPDILYKSIVREVYTSNAFRWSDWDCQEESDHADMLYLIRVELGEVEPPCEVCGGRYVYEGECEGDCYEQ